MKVQTLLMSVCAVSVAFLAGCASTGVEMVDRNNDVGDYTRNLDSRDFESAAAELVDSMLESGALVKPDGGRYVMAVSRVKNDTNLHIQPSLIVKKIRTALLKSGKVVVTAAMGGNGAEDSLVRDSRDLANDAMFNQGTVTQNGTAVAAELSLSGAMIQQENRIDKKRVRIDYYFQMQVTDLSSGLVFWEDEVLITKKATN